MSETVGRNMEDKAPRSVIAIQHHLDGEVWFSSGYRRTEVEKRATIQVHCRRNEPIEASGASLTLRERTSHAQRLQRSLSVNRITGGQT
jgi:hypothetical protein